MKKTTVLLGTILLSFSMGISAKAANADTQAKFPAQYSGHATPGYTSAIQSLLLKYNSDTFYHIYYSGGVDGSYGPSTVKAVISFQGSNYLGTDGSTGPATWRALYNKATGATYSEKNYIYYKGIQQYNVAPKYIIRQNISNNSWAYYNNGYVTFSAIV